MVGKIVYPDFGEPKFFVNGSRVSEGEFRETFPEREGVPGAPSPGCWPMESEALAVHPEQVAEANARNAEAGVSATYREDGICIIPSREDRRKLLKLEGFFDKNGGYGDG